VQLASSSSIKSDINVTPLVDVVLVLLIIFMVVTPMLTTGPPVQLPKTEKPVQKPEDIKEVLVVIDPQGGYWVDKTTMSADDFPAKIADLHISKPDGSVVIKADARLTYGQVKRAMFAVKEAGFTGVALIADRPVGAVGG
jgi:biopolymer transport protein TolR